MARNYSKISEKSTNKVDKEITNPIEITNLETKKNKKKEIKGIVTGCKKLKVRKEANAESEVLCIIEEKTKVVIEDSSNENFYKVCVASSVEGYCMKEFIKIK